VSAPATVDRIVARALTWGGLLSVSLILGGVVAAGLLGQLATPGHPAEIFTSLGDIRRALALHPPHALAVTALGLVCLLATPVAAVGLAIPAFWRDGDRLYAAIAATVLAMLLVSLGVSAGV
jgi:uncharacterized membrane protein